MVTAGAEPPSTVTSTAGESGERWATRTMPVSAAAAGGACQASAAPTPSAVNAQIRRRIRPVYPATVSETRPAPRDEVAGGRRSADQRRPWAGGDSITCVGGPCAGVPPEVPAGDGDDEGRGGTGMRAPPVAGSVRRSAGPVGWSAVTA